MMGWASFTALPDGTFFLSESYATEKECRAAYDRSDVDGYFNLALIPPEAIKSV